MIYSILRIFYSTDNSENCGFSKMVYPCVDLGEGAAPLPLENSNFLNMLNSYSLVNENVSQTPLLGKQNYMSDPPIKIFWIRTC